MMIRAISIVSCLLAVQTTLSQTSIDNPTATQCLAAPCEYYGECRSGSNECGEGTDYCNELSIWVPACGGGGTEQKETTITASTVQASDATSLTSTVQAFDTTSQSDVAETTDANNNDEPTSPPTTAWYAWTNSQNNEDESGGVVGYTTGKEGEEDWTPSNDTGWFDKQGWESGNRTNGEDESLFDKYNPFNAGEEDKSAATMPMFQFVWVRVTAVCTVLATLAAM